MIIEGLFNLFYGFLELIFSPVNIPAAPEGLSEAFDKFIEYLGYGESFFNLFFPINLTPFFVLFLAIWGWSHIYDFALWLLKKIPLFGIS